MVPAISRTPRVVRCPRHCAPAGLRAATASSKRLAKPGSKYAACSGFSAHFCLSTSMSFFRIAFKRFARTLFSSSKSFDRIARPTRWRSILSSECTALRIVRRRSSAALANRAAISSADGNGGGGSSHADRNEDHTVDTEASDFTRNVCRSHAFAFGDGGSAKVTSRSKTESGTGLSRFAFLARAISESSVT